jgi:hypothetical protein
MIEKEAYEFRVGPLWVLGQLFLHDGRTTRDDADSSL